MDSSRTEAELEDMFPAVAWRMPLPTRRRDGTSGFACRFCINMNGLEARDADILPRTLAAFEAHMRTAHGRAIEQSETPDPARKLRGLFLRPESADGLKTRKPPKTNHMGLRTI